ncbi:fatty acid-binding protein, liver-like [Nylanderia fulva]|uniref:fatty acid-binding protein, liver-like n=1 Tax=Nylanderia fulva TaxID=613905 RepID=UPI0010FBA297|nr:fatty acid-binding protein, liver-like [Nylanderia fulva]
MAHIVGKYQYESSENTEEFVKTIGKSELTDSFIQSSPIVEIQQNGDQWVVSITNQNKTVSSTFKLGDVYDERFPSQSVPFKSVTTKEGNGFKTETSLSPELKLTRVYEFTDTGMVAHVSTNRSDVKAKRIYKRL